MKSSSADSNRMKLTAIHLKQSSVNSITVCTRTLSFGFVSSQQSKPWVLDGDCHETSVVAEEGYVVGKDNSMCGALAKAN